MKIEDVKDPIVGEVYLAACYIRRTDRDWRTGLPAIYYSPVINHPHTDRENGQNEAHYHTDTRFMYDEKNVETNKANIPKGYEHKSYFRPEHTEDTEIQYLPLVLTHRISGGTTPSSSIKKSKLAHDCIHNGKCPHRGYDLTNEIPIDGVITCPLHGLRFDAETKKLLTNLAEV